MQFLQQWRDDIRVILRRVGTQCNLCFAILHRIRWNVSVLCGASLARIDSAHCSYDSLGQPLAFKSNLI